MASIFAVKLPGKLLIAWHIDPKFCLEVKYCD